MDTNIETVRLVPSVAASLEHLSDVELLAGTRRLVGRSNQLLAELLAHLAEVEARGIHRTRACSSLYTYCIYELRFSEDEAFRRVAAARLVRRFPALLDALVSGELHLTGILMLGPHLTEANLAGVLARAKHRTKREISGLVRVLDPLPAVPARIEPLGPARARLVPSAPTWEEFVGSKCPVRELAPGERPRDWIEAGNDAATSVEHGDESETFSGARFMLTVPARGTRDGSETTRRPAAQHYAGTAGELVGPLRYKVQFTATEEYVNLIDEAKALISHAVRNASIEDIQLRALRAFVGGLKKQRYAVMRSSDAPSGQRDEPAAPDEPREPNEVRETGEPGESTPDAESVRDAKASDVERRPQATLSPDYTRRRGRRVPAAVRRAIFERDEGRCSYVDATGRRCAETHRLEFHHLTPFARNGAHTVSNLTLRCAPHNSLAAEEDFGAELILGRKFTAHESFSAMTTMGAADANSRHAVALDFSMHQNHTRTEWGERPGL
jgi:hypothetical protein